MSFLKQRIGKIVIANLPVSPKVFAILRFEWAAARARLANRFWPPVFCKTLKIRSAKGLKVNLGCRDSLADWIPVDVRTHGRSGISWDIRLGLPFTEGSVALFYASHVLEHIDFRHDLPRLLLGCHHSLAPHGRIRIAVPDAQRFLLAYSSGTPEQWRRLGFAELPDDMPTQMCLVNHVFHQDGEHQFAFDFETMQWALKQSGFRNIVLSSFRASQFFPEELDLACHKDYSLYVEASKL